MSNRLGEMGGTRLEQSALTPSKTQISQTDGAKSGAPKDENDPDADLTWLCQRWQGLPESTRKQIIETARAALKSEGSKP